ncbi:hypothetical protein BX600DRAFT_474933 [Xylariales sp. PMI_506]|nr:hypothetical protein BX600DRAFT_474933 [Xylariales sp. PMI_506]
MDNEEVPIRIPTSSDASRNSNRRQRLEFIAVSGDALRGNAHTRRRVRSHAQSDYRRRNPPAPPPPRPSLTFELDTTSLEICSQQNRARTCSASNEARSRLVSQEIVRTSSAIAQTGLMARQDAIQLDGLRISPESSGAHSSRLWDHLYNGTCFMFQLMLKIGFINIVRETTALTQMLSTSAWHIDHSSGNESRHISDDKPSSTDYARYSVAATSSLIHRLSSPNTRASVQVVVAVLAFVAFANMINDPQLVNIHLDGLSQVLGHRGGLSSVEAMPVVRIMIYWVDVSGSFLQDRSPRYPQPFDILSTRSQLDLLQVHVNVNSLSPLTNLEQDPVVLHICGLIRRVNDIIEVELRSKGDEFWSDVLFPGFHLAPILHDLLSMPRGTINDPVEQRQRECYRLASILHVTELRGKFGADTEPAVLYATKLQTMINTQGTLSRWSLASNDTFLIWSLVVAASSSCVPETIRQESLNQLSACLQPMV